MPAITELATRAIGDALAGDLAPVGIHLTDTSDFRFKDIPLAGNLVSWNDRIGVRLAGHQYLKRNGAEQEPMGAEPGRFTMSLCFLGANWAKQYRALVASILADPRGEMVHPLLGNMKVACLGIDDANVTPGDEIDSINLRVSFVEDALDARLSETFPGPSVMAARVKSLALDITSAIGQFAATALLAEQLVLAAINYASAARALFESGSPADPSIEVLLDEVAIRTNSVSAALLVEAAADEETDATAYAPLQAIQQTYAACLGLAAALAASRPALIVYVVPKTTNVAALAASLYGGDAIDRIDEILRLNRIPNPMLIRAGTRLQVSTPTI